MRTKWFLDRQHHMERSRRVESGNPMQCPGCNGVGVPVVIDGEDTGGTTISHDWYCMACPEECWQ